MRKAAQFLKEPPLTVTAFSCERSPGSNHDFYSEGDYWWPDTNNPSGPYVQHDGLTNPSNFVEHRHAMIRMSEIVGTLTSAYLLTHEERYAKRAVEHLNAWFVNSATAMTPNLRLAQTVKGRGLGRSTGIIDTIHLVEPVRAGILLHQAGQWNSKDFQNFQQWFEAYLRWLTSSTNGLQERASSNNHGICWAMQSAQFAVLTGNNALLAEIRSDFKKRFVATEMAKDGSFPAELRRTKPYGYSLFVLDAMAGLAQIAATPQDDMWLFTLPDGRGMKAAVGFMFPYIENKNRWPGKHDVLYWDNWPVRQPNLLFSGLKFQNQAYLDLWKQLEADPATPEIIRNLPLRYPLLWFPEAAR
jgi:hypothetical protein